MLRALAIVRPRSIATDFISCFNKIKLELLIVWLLRKEAYASDVLTSITRVTRR